MSRVVSNPGLYRVPIIRPRQTADKMRKLPLPIDEQTPGASEVETTEPRSDPKQKAKERTRNNQKRCREKKKEHLQELQAKLREHEQQKMKATIEMQRAALKVIKENEELRTANARRKKEIRLLRERVKLRDKTTDLQKKEIRLLRAELNRHGISDDCIHVPPIDGGAMVPYRTLISDHTLAAKPSSTVEHLEEFLQAQRPECPPVVSSGSSSSQPPLGGCSGPSNSAPTGASSAVWGIPTPNGLTTQYQTVPAPETAMSRADAAMALGALRSINDDSQSPISSMISAGQIMQQQPAFDCSMNMFPEQGYGQPYPSRQRHSLVSLASCSGLPPNHMEIPRSENNCSAMTQLISSMTGLDPHQVRAELGCVPAMDYHVDNETFNSVVDWYAARSAIQM